MAKTKIPELLEKLEKLDLETWNEYGRQLIIHVPGQGIRIDPESTQGGYVLQGVIQDAIAARGWYWKVCSSQFLTQFVSRVGPMTNIREAQRDAPAEAILAAYVAALEEQG